MEGNIPRSAILLGLAFLNLGTGASAFSAFWPTKNVDLTNGGSDCDTSTEQYLMLEGQDWHDHPKFTLRWRQITGLCGEETDESGRMTWEASYDGSTDDAPDAPPTAGNQGRVQLNLYVCAPFGDYEIDLDVESYSDDSAIVVESPASTSWIIRNGHDQVSIWRTVYSGSASDEYRISPRTPGRYTWPLEGAMGYYSTIFAGPLPPLECGSTVPPGHSLVGCFADSKRDRLLNTASLELVTRGPDGMTAKICAHFCDGFDYFGLEFGGECFCGNADEFEDNAVLSDQCGRSITDLCTGDPTTACGGRDAIRVYKRLNYSLLDCFQDDKASRIMQLKESAAVMSAEICYEMCNDGINKYFGTQYANECWCAADADLMLNGEVLNSVECDMLCAGTLTGEYCGGRDKITAYEIDQPVISEYIGCYADAPVRAMNAEGKHVTDDMTNEVCVSYCGDKGHAFAGTQYGSECWCGDSFNLHGKLSDGFCSYSCAGDDYSYCGGSYALSVWSTDVLYEFTGSET